MNRKTCAHCKQWYEDTPTDPWCSACATQIIQILPSPGWTNYHYNRGEVVDLHSMVGWGLRRDGDIVGLSYDQTGGVMPFAHNEHAKRM